MVPTCNCLSKQRTATVPFGSPIRTPRGLARHSSQQHVHQSMLLHRDMHMCCVPASASVLLRCSYQTPRFSPLVWTLSIKGYRISLKIHVHSTAKTSGSVPPRLTIRTCGHKPTPSAVIDVQPATRYHACALLDPRTDSILLAQTSCETELAVHLRSQCAEANHALSRLSSQAKCLA